MDNLAIAPDYNPTEFASLALLEQGDVDVWVRRRGAILIEKSKETAKDCEAGKLASALAVGAAMVMSSNPLAWIPMMIGAGGYVYTVFQEFQDTGSVRLIPMYRGKLGDILRVMEGGQAAQRHPLEDEIEYLSEAEKDEVLLINYRFGEIAGVISSAPPKVRFDLYRHLCGQFHARRDLMSGDEVKHYINAAVSPARRTAIVADNPPALQPTEPVPEEAILNAPAIPPTQTLEAEFEVLDSLVDTRRSTLLIGDTGSGKSVMQAYVLTKLFEKYPGADAYVLSQKSDSFCGLADKGRVILFDPTDPEEALALISRIWSIYDKRRRLPESDRSSLSPVRLVLADWLSVNQALEDMKNDEPVKNSKYLTKVADVIYNGRELNVCLIVDLQSYNLAAVGLKADRNSRKNFNLIGLGNYSIDELGMTNDSYGVLENLISDRYIVADETQRISLNASFKELQPISRAKQRPIIFSGLSPARLALLPDLRKYKEGTSTGIRERLEALIEATPKSKTSPQSETGIKLLEIIQSAAKYPISFESIRKSRKWEEGCPDVCTLKAELRELESEWIKGNDITGYHLQD